MTKSGPPVAGTVELRGIACPCCGKYALRAKVKFIPAVGPLPAAIVIEPFCSACEAEFLPRDETPMTLYPKILER